MAKVLYFIDVFHAPDENRVYCYDNLLVTEDISIARETYENYAPTEAEPIVELWRAREGEETMIAHKIRRPSGLVEEVKGEEA